MGYAPPQGENLVDYKRGNARGDELINDTAVLEQVIHQKPAASMDDDVSQIAAAIDERILHLDPPSRIDVQEALAIVAVQEAGFVERLLPTAEPAVRTQLAGESQDGLMEQVVVVQFKRCPKELPLALAEGSLLRHYREALEKAGHSWKLLNSDMVFVHPNTYRLTMKAWMAYEAKPCFSLLFAESLEYLVEESIAGVGKGAAAKARALLNFNFDTSDLATASDHEPESDEPEGWPIVVARTFLDTAPFRRSPASVAQSSTEAHYGGLNPRRVASPSD